MTESASSAPRAARSLDSRAATRMSGRVSACGSVSRRREVRLSLKDERANVVRK